MVVRHLGHTDFNIIMECFLKAFENYYVKMPTDYNFYRNRWKAAKVSFDLSFGMFDGDKLVGFIINAIDKRQGENIAFNTGTGVLPEYRGKRIVKSIYDVAIPELKHQGIIKCALEVITENLKAIKAYKGIGFNICKTLKCFGGELAEKETPVYVKEVSFDEVSWSEIPNQDKYSWDFHYSCLETGSSNFYYVNHNDNIESFFSINSENGTINQLEILTDEIGNWERLFQAIQSISNKVRIINVDDSLEDKLSAIANVGLKNTVNQFEMELYL